MKLGGGGTRSYFCITTSSYKMTMYFLCLDDKGKGVEERVEEQFLAACL